VTRQFGQLGDLLIEFGQPALDAMNGLRGRGDKADVSQTTTRPQATDGRRDQQVNVTVEPLLRLIDQGLLALAEGDKGAHLRLTDRGVSQLARESLEDVFARLQTAAGSSAKPAPGADLVSEPELLAAVARSLSRSASCPLAVSPSQIEGQIANCTNTVSLAILIDMGYSMSRFSRFFWAKKSALAIKAMAETYFPADRVEIIGFYSQAQRIAPADLPLLMPKPVGIVNKHVSIRLPVDRSAEAPQHFTNLQMAIQLANETMAQRPGPGERSRTGDNKLMFVVLDGEPSACVSDGELVLQYPPGKPIATATLAEADTATAAGNQFTVFALIDDCFNTDWVGFVDRMVRRTRGVSFYCGSEDLAGCMLESYIAGKQPRQAQPAGSAMSNP
jgi:uncharacterized protein with von Willebrand factor type A (vWA) domain